MNLPVFLPKWYISRDFGTDLHVLFAQSGDTRRDYDKDLPVLFAKNVTHRDFSNDLHVLWMCCIH